MAEYRCGVLFVLWYAALCEGEHGYDIKKQKLYTSDAESPLGHVLVEKAAVVDPHPVTAEFVWCEYIEPWYCNAEDIANLKVALTGDGGVDNTTVFSSLDTLEPEEGRFLLQQVLVILSQTDEV
jgi:hypothetical protein